LIGGSPTDDPKLIKKAEKRIKEAKIVFTTCAGAGLGVLRKLNFTVVLIDEASQITEGVSLVPLVKGCQKAIMVGDQ
jgi:superfamily I DNA and/or RNA helicase